ncbi:MAG: hypothetical protein SGJ07_04330 [Rhodospirillaceae bacterium]|nr:hypothetical protein [Rhodospirillaceae bacterium]
MPDLDSQMNASIHWKAFFVNTCGLIAAATVVFGPEAVIQTIDDITSLTMYLPDPALWALGLVFAVQFVFFSWFQGYKILDTQVFGVEKEIGDFIFNQMLDAARQTGAARYQNMAAHPRRVRHLFYDLVNEMPETRKHAFSLWGRFYSLISCWAIIITWFLTTTIVATWKDTIDWKLLLVLTAEFVLFWAINISVDSLTSQSIRQLPEQQVSKIVADHSASLRARVDNEFQ